MEAGKPHFDFQQKLEVLVKQLKFGLKSLCLKDLDSNMNCLHLFSHMLNYGFPNSLTGLSVSSSRRDSFLVSTVLPQFWLSHLSLDIEYPEPGNVCSERDINNVISAISVQRSLESLKIRFYSRDTWKVEVFSGKGLDYVRLAQKWLRISEEVLPYFDALPQTDLSFETLFAGLPQPVLSPEETAKLLAALPPTLTTLYLSSVSAVDAVREVMEKVPLCWISVRPSGAGDGAPARLMSEMRRRVVECKQETPPCPVAREIAAAVRAAM